MVDLLKPWHEYCSERFAASADLLRALPGIYEAHDGQYIWSVLLYNLPAWAEHLGPGKRKSLQLRMMAYILDSYITRFRPHPPGYIKALLSKYEHWKRDGEGLGWFGWPLDGSAPILKKENVLNVRHMVHSQMASMGSTKRSLTLRPKGNHSSPGSPHFSIKRPLDDNSHESDSGKRQKSKD